MNKRLDSNLWQRLSRVTTLTNSSHLGLEIKIPVICIPRIYCLLKINSSHLYRYHIFLLTRFYFHSYCPLHCPLKINAGYSYFPLTCSLKINSCHTYSPLKLNTRISHPLLLGWTVSWGGNLAHMDYFPWLLIIHTRAADDCGVPSSFSLVL